MRKFNYGDIIYYRGDNNGILKDLVKEDIPYGVCAYAVGRGYSVGPFLRICEDLHEYKYVTTIERDKLGGFKYLSFVETLEQYFMSEKQYVIKQML